MLQTSTAPCVPWQPSARGRSAPTVRLRAQGQDCWSLEESELGMLQCLTRRELPDLHDLRQGKFHSSKSVSVFVVCLSVPQSVVQMILIHQDFKTNAHTVTLPWPLLCVPSGRSVTKTELPRKASNMGLVEVCTNHELWSQVIERLVPCWHGSLDLQDATHGKPQDKSVQLVQLGAISLRGWTLIHFQCHTVMFLLCKGPYHSSNPSTPSSVIAPGRLIWPLKILALR